MKQIEDGQSIPALVIAGRRIDMHPALHAERGGLRRKHPKCDDAEREYAYHTNAEAARVIAEDEGWLRVSMHDDFAEVFDPVMADVVVATAG